MGDWLDFGPYNDEEDDYDEDGETAEFETVDSKRASSVDNVYICSYCRHEYLADEGEALLFRTVVDVTQRYPVLDFRTYSLARMTVRSQGKFIAIEDTCQECWGRETWSRIQRAYGYPSRS